MFTQCPECKTVFRVSPEQLGAAGGKVRCSRCRSIFSALDNRFGLDRGDQEATPKKTTTASSRQAPDIAVAAQEAAPLAPAQQTTQAEPAQRVAAPTPEPAKKTTPAEPPPGNSQVSDTLENVGRSGSPGSTERAPGVDTTDKPANTGLKNDDFDWDTLAAIAEPSTEAVTSEDLPSNHDASPLAEPDTPQRPPTDDDLFEEPGLPASDEQAAVQPEEYEPLTEASRESTFDDGFSMEAEEPEDKLELSLSKELEPEPPQEPEPLVKETPRSTIDDDLSTALEETTNEAKPEDQFELAISDELPPKQTEEPKPHPGELREPTVDDDLSIVLDEINSEVKPEDQFELAISDELPQEHPEKLEATPDELMGQVDNDAFSIPLSDAPTEEEPENDLELSVEPGKPSADEVPVDEIDSLIAGENSDQINWGALDESVEAPQQEAFTPVSEKKAEQEEPHSPTRQADELEADLFGGDLFSLFDEAVEKKQVKPPAKTKTSQQKTKQAKKTTNRASSPEENIEASLPPAKKEGAAEKREVSPSPDELDLSLEDIVPTGKEQPAKTSRVSLEQRLAETEVRHKPEFDTPPAGEPVSVGTEEQTAPLNSEESSSQEGYSLPPQLTQKSRSPFAGVMWGLGILLLTATLALQYIYFHRLPLSENPKLRPILSYMCDLTSCQLPPRRDLANIELADHLMQFHPRYQESLLITATLINRADFTQPYPILEIVMTDLQQKPVARRHFRPEEYLVEGKADEGFVPNIEVPLMLEIVDPGENAVGFEFNFY